MMNHEIYSHVRLQRCNCIDEKMLHVLSCILLFCLDSSLVSCFQPNLLSHFCCFTLLEMFGINICFIVLVSISSKYLFVCFHCRGSSDDYKLQQYDGSNTPMIPKYSSLWWSLLYPLVFFCLESKLLSMSLFSYRPKIGFTALMRRHFMFWAAWYHCSLIIAAAFFENF